MSEREFDVVVFGATGVTGRLVAAYLAEQSAQTGARWAAAARDAAKLQRILAEDGVEDAPTIIADLGDPGSLATMAGSARVVLNLVGPYTLHGRPVIEACVAAGTHYADLTGEIPFVHRIGEQFGARAERAGAKLVQVCGFEALPPDMAVLLASEAARRRWDQSLAEVGVELSTAPPPGMPRPSDMLSGGTMQSMAAVAGDPDAAVAADPAALIDDPALAERVRARSPIELAPRRNRGGAVIAPMAPAAFINPAVIQRTAELAGSGTGGSPEPFRYREGIAIPGPVLSLPLRYALAGSLSATQAGFGALVRSRAGIRSRASAAMAKLLPSSGFGPAGDRLEDWSWHISVLARTTAGNELRVEIDADGHPGYLATARMLGEAGLLLAEPGATPERAGCLTPAIALGTASAPRFERARLRFSVAG